ncbi:MAG: curli assembly protein CsgF [Methylococcaceae bacterium]
MIRLLIACQLLLLSGAVMATELVFHFTNPNFGGNVGNGTFLMNQADALNSFKAPVVVTTAKTQIETFKDNLQRAILNHLATSTTDGLFDTNGNVKLGTDLNFDLNNDGQSDFSVKVGDTATDGNLSISITDGLTSTTLVVPSTVTKP